MDPDYSFADQSDPPFLLRTKLFLSASDKAKTETRSIAISGLVNGPRIEFIPNHTDLRRIYLGEEVCNQVQIKNVDGKYS